MCRDNEPPAGAMDLFVEPALLRRVRAYRCGSQYVCIYSVLRASLAHRRVRAYTMRSPAISKRIITSSARGAEGMHVG